MSESLAIRNLYCPSHFGNTFEVALPVEMREILSEAKQWGYNCYSDWFDTIDLDDVYSAGDSQFNMPQAVWAKKFANFKEASDLGFSLGLCVTPNHVFRDQVIPQNSAETNGHMFGQLVCPSKSGVSELVLKNYDNMFRDFVRRGIKLDFLQFGAYDYGGCACEDCQPWIVEFGKLSKCILELARKYFGQETQGQLWAWWWSEQDHVDFADWANREAPNEFTFMAYHIPYGKCGYALSPMPDGCGSGGFMHIGYGDKFEQPVRSYGHFGLCVAPKRIEETVKFMCDDIASGFITYCEGNADDLNRAILAGLASGQYASAEDVMFAWSEKHLPGDASKWVELLNMISDYDAIDYVTAGKVFDELAVDIDGNWRAKAVGYTIEMRKFDVMVSELSQWNDERIELARAYITTKEKLWSECWRVGLTRHIFRFDWLMPAWYGEYCERMGVIRQTMLIDNNNEV